MSDSNIYIDLFQKPLFQFFLIIAICLAAYSNTFDVPFHLDDTLVIVKNPIVKNLGFMINPSKAAIHNDSPFQYELFKRRYVGYLTFAINHRLNKLDVRGYHLVNLYIHIINALIVYWLVVLTFRTPFLKTSTLAESSGHVAFFASLFFVSHPLQTEAVTYIWQRVTILAATFYCLSLVMYVKCRLASNQTRPGYPRMNIFLYAGSVVSAVLAMKTKENAFTLPVAIFLYELMFFDGKFGKRFLYLAPLLLTMLIIPASLLEISKPVAELISVASEATRMYAKTSRWDYLFTQFSVIVTYLRLIFLPVNQNLDYDYPIFSAFFTTRVVSSFLLLIALFGFGIYLFFLSRNRDSAHRLIAFGIFWFFITISVESSFIPLANVIFEHRIYLPSVGVSIALTFGMFLLLNRFKGRKPYAIGITIFTTIIIVLSVLTYARNNVWRSTVSLWQDSVRKSPNKARPHNNLADALNEQGRTEEAIVQYREALRLNPQYLDAHNNLGNILARQGRVDEAVRLYLEAMKIDPDGVEAPYNLGNLLLLHNRTDEAIGYYMEAIRIKPNYVDAYNNLGVALYRKGDIKGATARYQEALRINPGYVNARTNLDRISADRENNR